MRFFSHRFLAGLTSVAALLSLVEGDLAAQDWTFTNAASEAGIDVKIVSGTPQKKFLVETMTGGVCALDFDGNDWADLFIVNGTTRQDWNRNRGPTDHLLRNNENGTFSDVTDAAGLRNSSWGMGCATADFDNDGDIDIYVTNFGSNALYRNNGDGTFSDIARQAGVDDDLWSTGAAFGDYDRDGDLDLYVANYVEFDFDKPAGDSRFCNFRGVTVACGPRGLPGAPDRLFQNDGDGTFTDVSRTSGIAAADKLYGFQALWTDLDMDGDLDVFVANDSTPNFLWRNNGNGTFSEESLFEGLAYNRDGRAQACMGADIGDYDGDGDLDIYATNFSDDYHVLYQNSGQSYFQDVTFKARIAQLTFQALGFGAFFADLNNNGWLDIFAANGHIYPEVDTYNLGSSYKQKNQLFENQGGGFFNEISGSLGQGLAISKSSRGTALLDYDRDGDMDIVVTNIDDHVDLLRNDLQPGSRNYIQVALNGQASNRDGIGSRVVVTAGGRSQLQELRSGSSYLSDSERVLHFGLGSSSRVDRLEITWPSGLKTTVATPPINQRILVHENKGLVGKEGS